MPKTDFTDAQRSALADVRTQRYTLAPIKAALKKLAPAPARAAATSAGSPVSASQPHNSPSRTRVHRRVNNH